MIHECLRLLVGAEVRIIPSCAGKTQSCRYMHMSSQVDPKREVGVVGRDSPQPPAPDIFGRSA